MKCLGEFDVEFRQLEYFCTISRLENFTRTAEVLHVSQPSVTKAIKALEAELQLTLIDRSQKHVTLTPEGKAFLLHAGKIYAYSAITERTVLPFLGDVLRLGPAGLPFGFASAGDIVLCAGVALLCFQMTRCKDHSRTETMTE